MAKSRILVVDDNAYLVDILSFSLEMENYEVLKAYDGEEALKIITENTPDLILADIMMPKMDGFELCKTLKEKEEYKDIPVVMVTALDKEEDKRRGIEAGAAAYIVKNAFEQSNLLDTVERLIG